MISEIQVNGDSCRVGLLGVVSPQTQKDLAHCHALASAEVAEQYESLADVASVDNCGDGPNLLRLCFQNIERYVVRQICPRSGLGVLGAAERRLTAEF